MINRNSIGAFFLLSFFSWATYGMHYTQATLFSYLEQLPDTPDKITIQSEAIDLSKPSIFRYAKDWSFSNIGYLNLIVNGPLTLHYALKVPTLSLQVHGLFTLGKSNDEMGVLAATHGPLMVHAHAIDARYGKLYGYGPTLIESTQGDITIGAPMRGVDQDIKDQYVTRNYPWQCKKNGLFARLGFPPQETRLGFDDTTNQCNGAYAASDSTLTLKSAAKILLTYGQLKNSDKMHIIAKAEAQNLSGKISSHNDITIQAPIYNHIREGAVNKPRSYDHAQYPGSGPAHLETLKNIYFFIEKVFNLAGSIRSGENISINGDALVAGKHPHYIEETQNFYTHGNYNVNGNPNAWAYQYHLMLTQSCITQAGDTITMNLGDFSISGNINAGAIAIKGKTGTFANSDPLRTTFIPTDSKLINVTERIQQEAQKPGIYQLAADGSVHTEFPLGLAHHPKEKYMVLLERESEQPIPNLWQNIFNPLSAISLELFAQRLISEYTGKIYQGNCSTLWKNAGKWRKDNQDIMLEEDLQHLKQSMLINQIGTTAEGNEQLNTMLCIVPSDVNPYQSPGDIVAHKFSCITEDNQTHLNDRIVATGSEGIVLESTAGSINLQTQSYTVTTQTHDRTTVEQIAMPQQQLIAPAGPITVHADQNVSRLGTAMYAGTTIVEKADQGAVTKNPLVLQKRVETTHEKKGFWSSSRSVETAITHSALPCETQAGTILHDKAGASIQSVASLDRAGQTIIYESPHTHIEGLLIANRATSSVQTSGMFTDTAAYSSKETPFAVPAQIQAPTIRFLGDARINANIYGTELHDETKEGIQFVAKIAQMLCSEQKIISSPLCEVDCGYEAGQEVMIQPMLMVEKIIRLKDTGCMAFESAIIDKNRTEIIGKFVETTYQLKQWQRNWNNVSQVISDEALVVIAFAVTLLTEGLGTELLASALQSITAATGMQLSAAGVVAVNAGFSAVCGGVTASTLRTGDPINAVKQQLSPAQLKSVGFTMASAGLCAQLGSMLDINMAPGMKTLSQHVQEQTVRTAVDGLLSIALNNSSPDAVLSDGLKKISFNAVAAYVSNEICASYMNEIGKQAAQTMVDGLRGFVQDNTRAGFIAGVTGSFTAQTVAALLTADAHAIAQDALAHLKEKGMPATPENVDRSIAHIVHEKMKYAKIAAASVAALTHQNHAIVVNAAANALDNNTAIRAQLAASAEYRSLLAATSQAYVILNTHQEIFETQYLELQKSAKEDEDKTEALNNPDGRKPFVKNPRAGIWFTACIADDLVLTKGVLKAFYLFHRTHWHKHSKCPFTIAAHGDATSVVLENKNIHPEGLNKHNMKELQTNGRVNLNADELAQLIRTSPDYKEKQHIHLFSCRCGIEDQGIAQQLADKMEVPVSAFEGDAAMNGFLFASVDTSESWIPKFKEIKTFYPQPQGLTGEIFDYRTNYLDDLP